MRLPTLAGNCVIQNKSRYLDSSIRSDEREERETKFKVWRERERGGGEREGREGEGGTVLLGSSLIE